MLYSPDAIRAAYDAIAEREDQFEKGFSLRNEIPREFIQRYLQPSDVVLDAGGGSGINAILMASRGARVTLLDISSRMLSLAARNVEAAGLGTSIQLVQGDITHLEQFPDATFTFVTCLGGSLSYVREQGPQAMAELARVACPGAILVLGCDSQTGFQRWLLSGGADRLDTAIAVYRAGEYEAGDGAHARLYTVAGFTQLVEQAGCAILDVGSTPALVDGWDQSDYPEGQREQLKELEMAFCTLPELLGTGHHLFCVARKR